MLILFHLCQQYEWLEIDLNEDHLACEVVILFYSMKDQCTWDANSLVELTTYQFLFAQQLL